MRSGLLLIVPVLFAHFGWGASLKVVLHDKQGAKIPCRVLVRAADGACRVPTGSVELAIGPDRWFMASGFFELEVPPGQVEIRVERGPEYSRFRDFMEVPSSGVLGTIQLERWINMSERGYRCGENHLHVEATRLTPMLGAEALDFGTSMTWWNGPDGDWCLPVPPGTGKHRQLEFGGVQVPTSIYDGEIEYSWGAAYFLNLPSPMPLRSNPDRPNLEFVRLVKGSGGLLFYQAGWSREVVIDTLLGYVVGVNVCNNNFHLHRFQPRSQYSNLLDVPGFPEYPDTDEGMLRMNLDSYYRILNWGLRLAAGAGSATGFKEVPVGFNRAYVRTSADANLEEFYASWAQGRNFVTNGPMLFLQTEDGKQPGDLVEFPPLGGKLRLRATALADMPLTRLELVVNGESVASVRLDSAREAILEKTIEINQGSWIAAYCAARDDLLSDEELVVYANGDNQQPSRLRFAHTSPIYVSVGGSLAAVPSSIAEGLLMIDRFESFARQTASDRYLAEILLAIGQAREVLRARMRDMGATSPDGPR